MHGADGSFLISVSCQGDPTETELPATAMPIGIVDVGFMHKPQGVKSYPATISLYEIQCKSSKILPMRPPENDHP